jgi:predicted dehydrogenase
VLRVGLIGCGRIAQTHIPYIRSYGGAQLVGVCDGLQSQAQSVARQFQIPAVYTDPGELLRHQHPDVVHVATPPHTHAELAIAAMQAGAHVLVEKPMAVTLAEADRMCETARRMGVQLCVDHNRVFDPVVRQARQLMARGVLGNVVGVEAWQGFARQDVEQVYGTASAGHWVYTLPAGIVQDIAPHAIALLFSFLPSATPVSVVTKQTGMLPGMPCEEVRMLFEAERALGTLHVSLGAQPYLNFLSIYGSQASLQLNLNNMTLLLYREPRLPKLLAKSWFNLDLAWQLVGNTLKTGLQVLSGRLRLYPGMGHLIHRFYTCLEQGGEPPVSMEAGRQVVQVLELISRQAVTP